MRFHDLRHATATLLLRAGVDAHRVQRILRYADIRTTLGTYGHLDVEDLREAINLLPAGPELPRADTEDAVVLPLAASAETGRRGAPVVRTSADAKTPAETEGDFPSDSAGIPEWALLVSNQRPPPCEDGALPLS